MPADRAMHVPLIARVRHPVSAATGGSSQVLALDTGAFVAGFNAISHVAGVVAGSGVDARSDSILVLHASGSGIRQAIASSMPSAV